jgi:hypothetical protein
MRRRRPPPSVSGVGDPTSRAHLPGAGLALGAAIGVVLGILAGGGVAIAYAVAAGTTLGLLVGAAAQHFSRPAALAISAGLSGRSPPG